ncbi:uncharacterized protein ATNIH1004_009256 [Aspergillus tanneri]|uniref:Uncharacterized protein n=1 Tax=Aspergillus tanneri TaxID=1220188 RepID=A0A5M9MDI4_9EURO|nr:uncharacterized protein ATNIH1004_009256 [Aspergillus tanneri]KAA8645045.1 hypothetical protein ATNIH1004_009256 [Aspergillus tanneri]
MSMSQSTTSQVPAEYVRGPPNLARIASAKDHKLSSHVRPGGWYLATYDYQRARNKDHIGTFVPQSLAAYMASSG